MKICTPWRQVNEILWVIQRPDGELIGYVNDSLLDLTNWNARNVYVGFIFPYRNTEQAKAMIDEFMVKDGLTIITDPRLLVMI